MFTILERRRGGDEIPQGQSVFTSNGTWTAPANVTSVSIVCIGGGGGGMYYNNSNSGFSYAMQGGGGGGLGWKNGITVVPGTTYNIFVGNGGSQGQFNSGSTAGGTSYTSIVSSNVLRGTGGGAGRYATNVSGGNFTGDGGGNGGGSTYYVAANDGPSGGGGAGGYSGNGGNGGTRTSGRFPTSGSGGGGAGGGQPVPIRRSAGGGGTGLLGQGSNGTANSTTGGGGGSGGTQGSSAPSAMIGGNYGGGGGGSSSSYYGTGGNGAGGAVRIMWGPNRSYPSTNTGDVTPIPPPAPITFTLLDTITGNMSQNSYVQKSYNASDGLVANSTGRLLIQIVASGFRSDMQVDDFNFGSGTLTFESSANSFETTTVGTGLTTYLSTLSNANKESTYNGLSFSTVITSTSYTSGVWRRGSNGTPSGGTGSTIDHTLGTTSGHTIYFEATSQSHPVGGYLKSPEVTLGSTPAINFWTSRYGSNMGNAEIWWVT